MPTKSREESIPSCARTTTAELGLGHCERANPEAKVQLIEAVVPEGNEMHFAKLLDVVMLVHTEGGQERTEKEYAELFEKAGYRLEQIIPTESPVSVIEAVPA